MRIEKREGRNIGEKKISYYIISYGRLVYHIILYHIIQLE